MDNQVSLEQALACYGLTGATVYPLRSYNNSVYRIERADQQRFSLRICGFANMQRRSMEDEMSWLAFVAQHNPRLAPRPIANRQGELVTAIATPAGERLCALFAWVEGHELHQGVTPADLRKIGRLVAKLHAIARQFPFPDAASDFRDGYRYDQSLMHSHYSWIEEKHATIGPANVALLHQAIEYVLAQLERIGATPANYGMIHADLNFGNLLVHEEEVYLIDFEQLGRGHFLYDLVVLWTELREHTTDFASLWQSFVAGYAEVAALPFRSEAELKPFVIATQLNFLDWFYNSMTPTVQAEQAQFVPQTYQLIEQGLAADGLL